MERSKTENQSAFAQALKRRDGVMREMLGMGSAPVGDAEGDKHHEPQVVIWRVAGDLSRMVSITPGMLANASFVATTTSPPTT